MLFCGFAIPRVSQRVKMRSFIYARLSPDHVRFMEQIFSRLGGHYYTATTVVKNACATKIQPTANKSIFETRRLNVQEKLIPM